MSIAKVITLLMLPVIVVGSAGSVLSSQAQAGQAGSLNPGPVLDVTRGRAGARASDDGVRRLKQHGWYDSLVAAVETTHYRVSERPTTGTGPGAYEIANPAQRFSASFTLGGMEMRPAGARVDWRLGMRLSAWGYGESYLEPGNAVISVAGNRVEYRYERAGETTITEWYVNTAAGIEQGFTLARPPAADRRSKPLTLVVAVSGDLAARLVANGNAIELVRADATAVLRYAKLRVWDATGRTLPSRLAVESGQVWLLADDTSAVYPVTVDPLVSTETNLTPSDGVYPDQFGFSLALNENADTVVVGAPFHTTGGIQIAGQAYVYVRSGMTWIEQAKLSDTNAVVGGDQFGYSVAISGDTVVVGELGHGIVPPEVFVYVRSGATWTEQTRLTASDAAPGDHFGSALAISGDTLVVGADQHRTEPGRVAAGKAYVYVRSGASWAEQAKLTASDAAAKDLFGTRVGISGDTVVVGASGFVTNTERPIGKAYVYVRSGVSWSEQAKLLPSDSAGGDLFGNAVAISGETVVVGAPLRFLGHAYVFARSGSSWSQQALLQASDAHARDRFGADVSVSGNVVVVGAQQHSPGGKAYVFVRDGTSWSEDLKLSASDLQPFDQFGFTAAVRGSTVLVGAPNHNGFVGQAYVYELGEGPAGSSLTALSPAKLWVGLKNSDDVGLRLDLKAEVFVNSSSNLPVGTGELHNVSGGSSGFNNAQLNTIPVALTGGPVTLSSDDQLLLRVSIRRTCFGGGHNFGTGRLWYNGRAIEGGAARDAGSRFDATIDDTTSNYFLRTGFALDTTAGSSRTFIDKVVNSSAACPGRPFTPFGTWGITP